MYGMFVVLNTVPAVQLQSIGGVYAITKIISISECIKRSNAVTQQRN